MYKNYFLVLFLLIGLSSCVPKQLIDVSSGHDASVPDKGNFILFKSGREMRLPDNLDIKSGILNVDRTRKIKVNDTKYAVKDIQSVQINGEYFVNIGKKQFVKRIYHGPLSVYNRYQTSTSTTYSPNGGGAGGSGTWSTSSSSTTHYFVQKDSVSDGEIVKFSGFGSQKKLMPFISDYQPSKDILKKYQRQRRISRIVKFSVAGLWAATVPTMIMAKDDSKLQNAAAIGFLGGMIAVPVFTYTFKYGNHKRPYKAVQMYIDSNFYKDQSVGLVSRDTANIAGNNSDSTSSLTNGSATTKDFVIINNQQQIVADSGSKLLVANNKIFSINGLKYSTDVTAFQLRKKFYKRIPKTESEFGLRVVPGAISVYDMTKESYWNNTNANNIYRNGYSISPIGTARNKQYYEKAGEGPMVNNPMKIGSYFQDDQQSLLKYNTWVKHVRTTKLVSYGLSAVTLGSAIWFVGKFATVDPSSNYRVYKDPLLYVCMGSGILNYAITINNVKKLNPELMSVIKGYNRKKGL